MAETTLRPFQVWLNVINALLLRDIRAGRENSTRVISSSF